MSEPTKRAPARIAASPELSTSPKHFSANLLTPLTLAVLVVLIWGAHNPGTGMPQETAFAYTSETTPALRAFLYEADPMRIHTNTFYHLGYLLGEAFGVRGSYVPYQVVFALLWFARGYLVFAILRKFLPDSPSLCYTASVFALVHSCDGATMLLGQMNQYGFLFWMLLAMYCFLCALDARAWRGIALITAAVACEYMSLWSYESQIVVMLAFPVFAAFARREWRKPVRLLVWYLTPAVYLALTYARYTQTRGQSYQESVMRKSWSLTAIASDWLFNIANSLAFWSWARDDWKSPAIWGYLGAAAAALVFAAGWILLLRDGRNQARENPFSPALPRTSALLCAGFATLALSFPVYLVLSSARSLWRTQMLSGIGCGIVVAALLALCSWLPLPRQLKKIGIVAAGALFVYCGSVSAIDKASRNRFWWERQRFTVKQILRIAPSVEPGTVIVMTGLPRNDDPFQDNMWFDFALRLAYPGIPVAGEYYYVDGKPAADSNLRVEGDTWSWTGGGFRPLVTTAPVGKTIVVEFSETGAGKLLSAIPPMVCSARCDLRGYDPRAAIVLDPVSPIAVHRFGLTRQEAGSLF